MRDDFQFACLTLLGLALTAGIVVLAVTNSGPSTLHDALLVVIGAVAGVAYAKKPGDGQ